MEIVYIDNYLVKIGVFVCCEVKVLALDFDGYYVNFVGNLAGKMLLFEN